jgi:uncharacterized surface protein with fasciclin (FAS1) repeats
MKIKNQIIKITSAFIVAFVVFSCTNDDNNQEIAKLPTIVEIAKADPSNFAVLVKALEVTGLTTTLNSAGSYTVFAPTNIAFATQGITETSLAALNPTVPADATTIASIKRILQNHVLGVATKADDLLTSGYVKTFSPFGTSTSVTLSMFINKSGADVLINGGVTNGGAKVTTANIDASNGIIHKVDNVIKLPTLVSHVKANPNFSTLLSVVTSDPTGVFGDQSALLTALNGATTTAPLTVFAPQNDAFTAATTGSGFLTGAIATPANISKVVQYHVSAMNLTSSSGSSWTSSTATSDVTITTLAPTAQKFKIALGTVKITELPAITVPASNIKAVNIQGTNGVIHTIDRVLQPVLP